ncbi:MAG: DinB family protein [Leptospira sp.]|uniref:DinB family protein n=1 Tax=Leptospira paudalimensis TaxID=2950024 RepID=A0ABT3M536_9LEPT|nr:MULTISPECIES: DinB family protein [Leptospira]MBL0953363.1 DinB family protein [Leptospira sp.]MCW7503493.1 DinB family protein [Leptospira paudalimensis]
MSSWGNDNGILLQQGITLLASLSDRLYLQKQNNSESSVGEHIRHVIEHYQMFLEGIQIGHIDYDKRKRDLSLEVDRILAINRLQELFTFFETKYLPLGQVLISQNYNPDAPTPIVTSTIERELLFLVSHTVHHYAIIALVLKDEEGVIPPYFGYSPATLYAKLQSK